MFEARADVQNTLGKSRLILDRRFAAFDELNIGETGQAEVSGVVDSERMEPRAPGDEVLIKTVKVASFEVIHRREYRA